MNYCPNCGKENTTNSNFCPNCGQQLAVIKQVANPTVSNTAVPTEQKTNSFALAGFITALISLVLNFWGIVGIVATVLSGVGLSQTRSGNEKGNGIAIAGLVIGIFSIIYGVLAILFTSMY